jgi:hypothetical protein
MILSGISYTHVEGTHQAHQEGQGEAQPPAVTEPLPKGSAARGWLWIVLLIAIVVALALGAVKSAEADTMGWTPSELAVAGKEYIEWDHFASGSEEHRRADSFYWFVMGSLSTLAWQKQICAGSIQGAQIATMVAKYLNGHPEMWQRPTAELILAALQPTFPCSRPKA